MSLLLAAGATPVNYVLTCDVGSYTYTGIAADLKVRHSLVCAAGAYTYTGVAATLNVAHSLVCSPGAYTYTGQDATLRRGYSLACDTGVYSYSGIPATLTYSTASVETTLQVISAGGGAAQKKRKRKEKEPFQVYPVVVEAPRVKQQPQLFINDANPDTWPRLKDNKAIDVELRAEQNRIAIKNRVLAILLLAA